eukprot:CCRYP_020883-RA/>CCRYP_020883-RA protein AED:0.07 eAED:0.07 QI:183/1/1/1/0.5/0.33/3/83/332
MVHRRTHVRLESGHGFSLSLALLVVISVSLLAAPSVEAFLFARSNTNFRLVRLSSASRNSQALDDPATMRLREIQLELKQRNVSFADCFDRDSLTKRLLEAREGSPIQTPDEVSSTIAADQFTPTNETARTDSNGEFDRQAVLTELRNLKIKALREQLSQYNVRWGNMIEKEELVQALCKAKEERYMKSQNFSRSGEVIVGEVCDASEDVLLKELGWSDSDLKKGMITSPPMNDSAPLFHAPILLDVYATWCGPCQFMVPHFKEAAKEFGPEVRVIKLDSDKYSRIASALKVGGLPSIILFDGGDVCKEVDRIEGALTKDQLVAFVKRHFST